MASPDFTATPGGRDRRDIVTPYAFHVDPRLIGLPLASPWRRLAAISLDGAAVAMLSKVPGGFLVLLASIVLFRWAAGWRGQRRALRWVAAVFGVLALWSLYGAGVDLLGGADRLKGSVGDAAALPKLALEIDQKKCLDAKCAREPVLKFARFAGTQGMTDAKAVDAINDVLADLPIDDKARDELRAAYLKRVAEARKAPAAAAPPDADDDDAEEVIPGTIAGVAALTPEAAPNPPPRRPIHSLIAWARGLLDDLGIGLGWSALYFTAFCAYWNGQTPGKRLLGIRVVQLDASPMTLWESFERYGGYGAGFATGLLGFVQVFWDSNRQAIHDKICETVVIRGDLPSTSAP